MADAFYCYMKTKRFLASSYQFALKILRLERKPSKRRKVYGIVVLILLGFGFYCVHLHSQTRQIALDLVNRTDSPSLHGIGSELQATLTELRSAPARVESCRL